MITGFLLGLMGSLHCAGMCGALVLMTPVVAPTQASFVASRLVYHAGRIFVYALIGVLFGIIGESMVFAGFQRWLSIIAGVLMIAALVAAKRLKSRLMLMPMVMKTRFSSLLRQRSYPSIFALGGVNGLLPCGLVYMAATASIASGDVFQSVASMVFFGLGTLPVLLGISFAGKRLNLSRIPALQKVAPVTVALAAILLIIRADPIGLFTGGPAQVRCAACAN
jgi:uncharacterized protein